jgi:hypothetical protein
VGGNVGRMGVWAYGRMGVWAYGRVGVIEGVACFLILFPTRRLRLAYCSGGAFGHCQVGVSHESYQ